MECGDNVYQRVRENATVEDFELFVKQLKDENKGARFFEREVVGNKFFGVQLEEGYVYVLYFDCVKELRIQYATEGELVPEQLGDKDFYVGEKKLTQFSPTDPVDGPSGTGNFGMCYVFTLGEGHFLVYDGMGDHFSDYERIFDTLRENTPIGQTPVIDAWIFTHEHYDHIAGAAKLAKVYGAHFEVRNILMNIPEPRRYAVKLWHGVSCCRNVWMPAIYEAFPDAKIWKIHTGQRFFVGQTEVEVLFTQEEITQNEIFELNSTSLFTRVFFEGKSIALPADTQTEPECQLIHDLYGSYLKSDYYQVAHHGWDTFALSFYYDIDPEFVLWPVRKRHWYKHNATMRTFPASEVLWDEMKAGKRKFYIAIDDDDVIKF